MDVMISKGSEYLNYLYNANLIIFFSDFKIQVVFLRLAHVNALIVVDTDLLQGG